MADNVAITAGAGTSVATDDVGGVHYQRVKLDGGADGASAAIPGSATHGLKIDDRGVLTRVSADSAGLTTSVTAYSAGDTLGTLIELTGMAAASGGYGMIRSLRLLDDAIITLGIEAFLFDRSVTLASDNAAFAVSDADMAFCQGSIIIPAGSGATNASIAKLTGMAYDYKCNVTSLFVGLKTMNAHTFFTAADDLHLTVTTELAA